MSLKKIKEVKSDRGFKIWDILIYGGIIALVAALLIALFVTKDSSPLKGFKIYVVNEVVYEYDFEKGELRRGGAVETLSQKDEVLTLKVTAGSGYNIVEVGKNYVRVTDADCPKKDCIYTPAISDNGGIIYCLAHGLKILPAGYDEDNGNLIQ